MKLLHEMKQPPLERPVCASPCVLLAGHSGRCIASNGKTWARR